MDVGVISQAVLRHNNAPVSIGGVFFALHAVSCSKLHAGRSSRQVLYTVQFSSRQ